MKTRPILLLLPLVLALSACGNRGDELTLDEASALKDSSRNELLLKTVSKPGGGPYPAGHIGGSWVGALNNDPKTFNTLTARDGDSRAVIDGVLNDYLADYDANIREFKPNLASFEVEIDEAGDTMRIIYTLRDDLYWTTPDSDRSSWVRVTSDDVVYWYDDIVGDKTLQQPEYPGQFVEMPNGEERRIEIEKIDDRRFAFKYPRIVANPILSTNMTFGPKHLYEKAKREGGVDALLSLFSVDTDPKTIPSDRAVPYRRVHSGRTGGAPAEPRLLEEGRERHELSLYRGSDLPDRPRREHGVPAVQGRQERQPFGAAGRSRGAGHEGESRLHRLQRRRGTRGGLLHLQPEPGEYPTRISRSGSDKRNSARRWRAC